MASLSYDITEFRVEASVGRETQQRAKRRHGSCVEMSIYL